MNRRVLAVSIGIVSACVSFLVTSFILLKTGSWTVETYEFWYEISIVYFITSLLINFLARMKVNK